MEVDPDTVLLLAKQIDPESPRELAELFTKMLQEEHSSRHRTRPGIYAKFTKMIDDDGSGT